MLKPFFQMMEVNGPVLHKTGLFITLKLLARQVHCIVAMYANHPPKVGGRRLDWKSYRSGLSVNVVRGEPMSKLSLIPRSLK